MANKRASPGVGHNSNSALPTQEDVRTALAFRTIIREEEKKLREKKKRINKKIEGMSIPISEITWLESLRDKTGDEIVQIFKIKWSMIGAVFSKIFEQYDIFKPKPAADHVRAAHYTMGLLKGLDGEDLAIPPNIVGDERQQLIDGHNEGKARRKAAEDAILKDALGDTSGKPADGTAAAVSQRAAKDFAADQQAEGKPDPLVVDGERYATMRQANAARARAEAKAKAAAPVEDKAEPPAEEPTGDGPEAPKDEVEPEGEQGQGEQTTSSPASSGASPAAAEPQVQVPRPKFEDWSEDLDEWFATDKLAFQRWFDSLPPDHVPAITHKGAVAYWRQLVEQRKPAALDPDESFAATDEELAQQTGRGQRQEAEVPDPKEIERQAQALKEKGFVDGPTAAKAEAAKRRANLAAKK